METSLILLYCQKTRNGYTAQSSSKRYISIVEKDSMCHSPFLKKDPVHHSPFLKDPLRHSFLPGTPKFEPEDYKTPPPKKNQNKPKLSNSPSKQTYSYLK